MRKVAVVGVGSTKFGELWEIGMKEMIVEAGAKALEDSKVDSKDIQALYIGSMAGGRFFGQEHLGALIADYTGLNPLPSTRVEAGSASGAAAFREGYLAVASGEYDLVVVGGGEKSTDVSTEQAANVFGGAGDIEWEIFNGATFPSLFALMARRHMHEYGTTEEQMAAVAVKNHKNGAKNPIAQFPFEVSIEAVMNSGKVSDPIKTLDSCAVSDGACAVVLASEEAAKNFKDKAVWVNASTQTSDTLALHDRPSLTTIPATRLAGEQALKKAGITHKDVQLLEVHDAFTISELMALEDLGFVKKGEVGKAVAEGRFDLGSGLSVNTSGGLKACGHPAGATGLKQVIEICLQLRGEAGKRQVQNARIGMTHSLGGTGGTALVHVLSREKDLRK